MDSLQFLHIVLFYLHCDLEVCKTWLIDIISKLYSKFQITVKEEAIVQVRCILGSVATQL